MRHDCRALAVTTDTAAAVAHLDDAVRSFLAHRSDTGAHLDMALAADSGLALGRCFAGMAQLLLGRGELVTSARVSASLARAAIRERGATRREQRVCDALTLWLAGDMESCAATLEAEVRNEPLDALSLKLAHAVRFMLGDAAAMRRAAAAAAPAWTPATPGCGFVLGCHAFALEETGELRDAERRARQALDLEPDDVWGRHALVHVHEMRGAVEAGLALLHDHAGRLGPVNNFAHHLAWHEALFQIARGDRNSAFDVYDRKVRHDRTDDYRDIANGASLLWHFERRGWDVGDRWRELADIAERRLDDGALAFAQLHYLLCLVGAGRGAAAARLLAAMRARAEPATGTQAGILRGVGLPLGALMVDAAMVDRRDLAPLARALNRLGGSHRQRAIFVRMIEAARDASRIAPPPLGAAA